MSLFITNIQRFCVDDGPGIRTTVFLKGCPLKCPWCCNPETRNFYSEIFFKADRCLYFKGCNLCLNGFSIRHPSDFLSFNKNPILLKKIIKTNFWKKCPTKAIGIYGYKISCEELLEILNKDKIFFEESGGGVTFSGGEPLLQNITDCLKIIKENNFHITVETSLFVPSEILKKSLKFIDLFIVDIKILSSDQCKKILGGNIDTYFQNVDYLISLEKEYIFRFPVVKPYTYNEKNIQLLFEFIEKFKIKRLEIFSIHNLGEEKYKTLGYNYKKFPIINGKDLIELCQKLGNELDVNVTILEW